MDIQWNREAVVKSAIGVVSFGAGVVAGYAIYAFKHRRELNEFRSIMESFEEEALENLKKFDENQYNLFEEIVMDDISEEEELVQPTDQEHHSVWPIVEEEIEDDWDYAVEERARELNPNNPYVIHREEYENDDNDYSQSTLTYYKGDDVLCDDQDIPIYNYQTVASPLHFGKGSDDPNVVYIRNDRLRAEYEVLLDHGHFSVEILGQEIEHSFEKRDRNYIQKFRPID